MILIHTCSSLLRITILSIAKRCLIFFVYCIVIFRYQNINMYIFQYILFGTIVVLDMLDVVSEAPKPSDIF